MKFLLDTHTLLWWPYDPLKLSAPAADAIEDTANEILISSVIVWEIAIKESLKKLKVNSNLLDAIGTYNFSFLLITHSHAWETKKLPLLHRDPFDRLLVAQSIVESAVLVTRDPEIERYSVNLMRS